MAADEAVTTFEGNPTIETCPNGTVFKTHWSDEGKPVCTETRNKGWGKYSAAFWFPSFGRQELCLNDVDPETKFTFRLVKRKPKKYDFIITQFVNPGFGDKHPKEVIFKWVDNNKAQIFVELIF